MAVYQFSALSDGQAIAFNPGSDVLNFDQTAIAGADVLAVADGSSLRVSVGDKDVLLLNVVPFQVTSSNITFANGSRLLYGDNTTGTANDNLANWLTGTAGRDHLAGFGGNDTLFGAAGNDVIEGGAGNDSIGGNDGADWLEGGAGNDTLSGGSAQDSFVFREAGAANADLMSDFATGWDNVRLDAAAFANAGPVGRFAAGDARFYAAAGATAGHDADDRVIFNTSTGQIFYDADGNGTGAAQLVATLPAGRTIAASDIWIFGTPGGGSGGVHLVGTSGNDSLVGGPGNDTLEGLAGNDTLVGNAGNDLLTGGDGSDLVLGGDGDDTIDSRSTFFGADTVDGGAGFDTEIMHSGIAGAGIERLILRGYDPSFGGPDGHGNELDNIIIDEGPGGAFLYGNGGNDTLLGSDGGNFFVFLEDPSGGGQNNYGHDSVVGGDGTDWLLFEQGHSAITVDMRNGIVTGGGTAAASVTFTGIEVVQGTVFGDVMTANDAGNSLRGYGGNDTLTGGTGNDALIGDAGFDHPSVDPGNDRLLGGAGNDTLVGEEGVDWLDGGAGQDRLTGGGGDFADGADNFVFSVAPGTANADTIADIVSGSDHIVLDGNAHASIGASGNFAAGDDRFFAGAGAGSGQDAEDRVIYNTSTGQLWYDADGSGAGAAQIIATLEGAPSLLATDITVINGSAGGGGSNIVGTSGADTLTGTAGNDTLSGLGGNDMLVGSGGNDVYDGGANFDTLNFTGTTTGLVVNFAAGTVSGGFTGTFVNMERVLASGAADSLTGAAGGQNLSGRGGNDTVAGGTGNDSLYGGTGADDFVFREFGSANADRIGDFAAGTDDLALEDAAFSAIGALGDFSAGDARFHSGAGLTSGQDASDRVIYNTSTGQLYYDADGSGAIAAQLVATLTTLPALAATDITVI